MATAKTEAFTPDKVRSCYGLDAARQRLHEAPGRLFEGLNGSCACCS